MSFSKRLKTARQAAGLTQTQLAGLTGLTGRAIQNYESGSRRPQRMELVDRLAAALGTTSEILLDGRDILVIEAQEKGGARAAHDVEKLVGEVKGLFAGGELDDSEKDAIMAELNRVYWEAKSDNKKYAPKKYRV